MKIKVSEAEGAVLNQLVNMADGLHGVLAPVAYSSNWSFGGPIIERERIACRYDSGLSVWWATSEFWPQVCGRTPLIAAMRCFVMSRLGDEVEVPEELI